MRDSTGKAVPDWKPGHPLLGQYTSQGKTALVPLQMPGIIRAQQSEAAMRQWAGGIERALTAATDGVKPKEYVLPHYRISKDPEEIIPILQSLIDKPKTLVAFDTETTGLRAFEEGAAIVYVMLRWEVDGEPRSIGFPWDYPESPLKPHIGRITPYLVAALQASVLIGHNLSFDALFASANLSGADLDRLADACVYDTWHEAFVIRQARGSLSLDMMAYKYVPELGGYDEDFTMLIELYRELLHPEEGGHYAKCPVEFEETHLKPYVMGDVEVTYRTHKALRAKFEACKTYKIPLAHPDRLGAFKYYSPISRQTVYDRIVSPASRMLIKMMGRGLKVDIAELSDQEEMLPKLIFDTRRKLREMTPEVLEWCEYKEAETPGWFLDLESKDHLREILFKRMRLPVKAFTPAGKKAVESITSNPDAFLGPMDKIEKLVRRMVPPQANQQEEEKAFTEKLDEFLKYVAIDKFTLNVLAAENPSVRPLLEYRSIFKQYASYVRPIRNVTTVGIDKKARTQSKHLARDGFVHAQFMITGTRSGRLSSNSPNLQQLGGHIKRVYTTRFGAEGCLYQGDLSQIELRLIAAACGDESMVGAYRNNIDLHSLTMSKIFKMPYDHCIKDHVIALQKAGNVKEAKECEQKRKISKCVDLETLVSVDGCIVRVGDLHSGRDEDTFYPMAGRIQGPTGPVPLKHFYSNGVKKRLLVCTKRGIIACSEEHPLLMADGTLKKAKDIRKKDVLAEPVPMHCGNIPASVPFNPVGLSAPSGHFKLNVDADLAYRLGLYYGAGECTSTTETALGRSLRLPTWLFNAPRQIKISFLAGWIDAEGCVRQGSVCGITKSWVLAQDICVLLASLGAQFSITPGFNKEYNTFYYRITVCLEDTWALFKDALRHPDKLTRIRLPRGTHQAKPNLCTEVIELEPAHLVDVEVDTPEHLFVANNLVQRNTVNFLTGYGGGAQGLQGTLAADGIYKQLEECEAILEAFFDSYPSLREFLAAYKSFIERTGVAVSMLGRVRIFEEVLSADKGLKNKALRAGCNHLIQATASDMMLCCICAIEKLMRAERLRSKLVSTVHDSLLVDTHRKELPVVHEISMSVFNNIPEVMETWLGEDVNLSWIRTVPYSGDAEAGKNYYDMNRLNSGENNWEEFFARMDEE
jgi:DNA polymerase I-like protein with 3'-5' exonuclease and polymerase domains